MRERKGFDMGGSVRRRGNTESFIVTWYDEKKGEKKGETVRLYSYQGKPLDSKRIAERLLNQIRAEYDKGILDINKYKPGKSAVSIVADEFIAHIANYMKPSTLRNYTNIIESTIKPYFVPLGISVAEISYKILCDFVASLTQKKSSKHIIFGILVSMLRYAMKQNYLVVMPPFPGAEIFKDKEVKLLKGEDAIIAFEMEHDKDTVYSKYLSSEEQISIINTFPEPYRPILMFLVLHYRRPAEACALLKTDFKDGVFTIKRTFSDEHLMTTTKTEATHIIPMAEEFKPYLEWMQKQEWWLSSPFFFVNPHAKNKNKHFIRDSIYSLWRRRCIELGKSLSLYQGTKHSACTQLVNEYGYTLEEVQLATDHKSLRSVKHYVEVGLEMKRRAINKQLRVIPLADYRKVSND